MEAEVGGTVGETGVRRVLEWDGTNNTESDPCVALKIVKLGKVLS